MHLSISSHFGWIACCESSWFDAFCAGASWYQEQTEVKHQGTNLLQTLVRNLYIFMQVLLYKTCKIYMCLPESVLQVVTNTEAVAVEKARGSD